MRGDRSRLGLWLVGLVIAFGPSCMSVRRPARTTVGVEGAYSNAEDVGFSCDDEPPIQRHHQAGGRFELKHHSARADHQHAEATVLIGGVYEHSNVSVDPSRSPYAMIGLGGGAGWDFEYFGHDLGATMVFVPQGINDAGWIVLLPYYRLRAGMYEGVAAEGQIGARHGLFETNYVSAGLRFGEQMLEVHMGGGLGGRLMVNQGGNADPLLLGTRGSLDWSFYTDGELELNPCWRLTFGFQIGRQYPVIALGVNYAL